MKLFEHQRRADVASRLSVNAVPASSVEDATRKAISELQSGTSPVVIRGMFGTVKIKAERKGGE